MFWRLEAGCPLGSQWRSAIGVDQHIAVAALLAGSRVVDQVGAMELVDNITLELAALVRLGGR